MRALLNEIGADFVRVVVVDAALHRARLGDALEAEQLGPVVPLAGLPRVVLLSGMTSEEVLTVIDELNAALELPRGTHFAAAVPNSINKTVAELLEEIEGDAAALAKLEPASS